MHRMRVLHVVPYAADAWAYGGIPRVSAAVSRGLADRGHAVTVCTTDACDSEHRLPRQRRASRSVGRPGSEGVVETHVFRNVSNRLAYRYQCFLPVGLASFLRQHAASFDVAHLHACRNVPGSLAAHYLHRAGVPYVLAPNGTAPNVDSRRLAKSAFDLMLGRRMMARAHRLLAVTHAEREQLEQMGVAPSRIRVIPNPVQLDQLFNAAERGRYRRHRNLGGPRVVYLGQLIPRKRADLLVRAFARLRLPQATLVIAGNDMGAGFGVRAAAAEVGVADRTIFAGLVTGRARLELLADADVVVYPSVREIFGLVPLEALLSGTPVVVADDSGCAEVVTTTGGGLVVKGEVEAIASAIATILNAPAHWRLAANRAADCIRRLYAPDVVCAQLELLYSEMAH